MRKHVNTNVHRRVRAFAEEQPRRRYLPQASHFIPQLTPPHKNNVVIVFDAMKTEATNSRNFLCYSLPLAMSPPRTACLLAGNWPPSIHGLNRHRSNSERKNGLCLACSIGTQSN